MELYHTSTIKIEKPDIRYSRDYLDFGKGFYLTSIYEQAIRYGHRFMRRQQSAWINKYSFSFNTEEWNVLRFESYNSDWLHFISKCRAGKDDTNYDIVIGGIADDKVIQTLDRFFEGELSEESALGLLKFERPNIQFCIRSQKMIDECITHIDSLKL